MRVVAIVQARMGSMRLPNKVMKPINGTPMIGLLLKRLEKSCELDQIVVATSVKSINAPLKDYVEGLGFACEQGSEDDVLERYLHVAEKHGADIIVRITGDCPLVDPELVDQHIRKFKEVNIDYLSNTIQPTYPDGLDVEVTTLSALRYVMQQSNKKFDHEHVTPYIRESDQFTKSSIQNDVDLSELRWTVDEPEDFEVISNVFNHFSPDIYFGWKEVLALQNEEPQLFLANQKTSRNEGVVMGKGQKLWRRAKRVIPGGNMLLSKRSEMFLPNQWPSYFSKAKGCKVWDLDGCEYIDMSLMGGGTNILGYGHSEVDEAVHQTVSAGNMSTFNCAEEVYLCEKLVGLHSWADMARLARSGSEANAISIQMARAASGRDNVAVCGYRSFNDWNLSANCGDDKSLARHLRHGLDPEGVPQSLRKTVYPFSYNNIEELERLANTRHIGVIIIEMSWNEDVKDGFLKKVRQLAIDRGIVLIFDECTSGFRQTFGGLHGMYGVEPDMAIFGKALGNGYAISAILGRREIMDEAQAADSSSIFWTERIGPTAALKALEVMERDQAWETITKRGLEIRNRWQQVANRYALSIKHWGLPALTGFTIQSANSFAYKTLITQEMKRAGYLAGTSVYVCTEHTSDIVDGYFEALDSVFKTIKECEEGADVESFLKGPVCYGGFDYLN